MRKRQRDQVEPSTVKTEKVYDQRVEAGPNITYLGHMPYQKNFDNPLDLLTSVATSEIFNCSPRTEPNKSRSAGDLVRSDSGYIDSAVCKKTLEPDVRGWKTQQRAAVEALQSLQQFASMPPQENSPPTLTETEKKESVSSIMKADSLASAINSAFFAPETKLDASVNVGGRSRRARPTDKQTEILMKVFEWTFFPSSEMRNVLAANLGLHRKVVQVWFQNKRQQWRIRHDQVGVGRGASSFVAALQAKQQRAGGQESASDLAGSSQPMSPSEQETASETSCSSGGSQVVESCSDVTVPPIRHEVVSFEVIMVAVEQKKSIAQMLQALTAAGSKLSASQGVASRKACGEGAPVARAVTCQSEPTPLSTISLQSAAWMQSATKLMNYTNPRNSIHSPQYSHSIINPLVNIPQPQITLPKHFGGAKSMVGGGSLQQPFSATLKQPSSDIYKHMQKYSAVPLPFHYHETVRKLK